MDLYVRNQYAEVSWLHAVYLPLRKVALGQRSTFWCCCPAAPCDPLAQSGRRSWSSPVSDLHFPNPKKKWQRKGKEEKRSELPIIVVSIMMTSTENIATNVLILALLLEIFWPKQWQVFLKGQLKRVTVRYFSLWELHRCWRWTLHHRNQQSSASDVCWPLSSTSASVHSANQLLSLF